MVSKDSEIAIIKIHHYNPHGNGKSIIKMDDLGDHLILHVIHGTLGVCLPSLPAGSRNGRGAGRAGHGWLLAFSRRKMGTWGKILEILGCHLQVCGGKSK